MTRFGPSALRRGFALPLALFALVVLAMLSAFLLDGALQEVRISRGDVALASAQAAAETGLADVLVAPADTSLSSTARGTLWQSVAAHGADTVRVTMRFLGGGLIQTITSARSWSLGVRADASTLALLRVQPDSAPGSATLRFHRLPGWWWARVP